MTMWIELNGSVELGPLRDWFRRNTRHRGERPRPRKTASSLEKICDISARLIVNRVSLKTRSSH